MSLPWSIQFGIENFRRMSFLSVLRYRQFVLREDGTLPPKCGFVSLRMKQPVKSRILLREPGTDFWTFNEVFVREIYRGVRERVSGCAYAVDLGANIGLTSLYFAAAFPTCRVLGVEPFPGNQEMYRCNVAKHLNSGQCELVAGAVWKHDGFVDLSCPPNGDRFDAIHVDRVGNGESLRVPAYSIPTLLDRARFPRIDILKVDIEGAEKELFYNNPDWLDCVNAITIEFHGRSRVDSRFDEWTNLRGFQVIDDDAPNTVLAIRPQGDWRR